MDDETIAEEESSYAGSESGHKAEARKAGGYSSRIEQMLHEHPELDIQIVYAGKNTEGGGSYITYTIRTGDVEVRRRYSEFASLRQTLVNLHPTLIIPPIPEKHTMADYAAKPTKAKEDLGIIELRQRMLATFLNRCRRMKEVREDGVWTRFLDPNASWVSHQSFQSVRPSIVINKGSNNDYASFSSTVIDIRLIANMIQSIRAKSSTLTPSHRYQKTTSRRHHSIPPTLHQAINSSPSLLHRPNSAQPVECQHQVHPPLHHLHQALPRLQPTPFPALKSLPVSLPMQTRCLNQTSTHTLFNTRIHRANWRPCYRDQWKESINARCNTCTSWAMT